MGNAKLIAYINKHEWWRTTLPDKQEVKARGMFFMNSYRQAEFYGRPIDTPFRVKIKNVLFQCHSHYHLIHYFLNICENNPFTNFQFISEIC